MRLARIRLGGIELACQGFAILFPDAAHVRRIAACSSGHLILPAEILPAANVRKRGLELVIAHGPDGIDAGRGQFPMNLIVLQVPIR